MINTLYEDFLKCLKEWKRGTLKSFVTALGFDFNEVTQESDTHATLQRGDITFVFYAEDDTAALNVVNTNDLTIKDHIRFKWIEGEWVEKES